MIELAETFEISRPELFGHTVWCYDRAEIKTGEIRDDRDYYDKIPACCKVCYWFNYDWNEWTDTTAYYCELNLLFPTKKKTCKRQKITR